MTVAVRSIADHPAARAIAAMALLLAFATAAHGERLPLWTYDMRDGLAHPRINDLFRDHRGYLWLATWEGLSRFDGERFVSYGTRDGLPNPLVWAVAEDSTRRLWVALHEGGIARYLDRPLAGSGLGAVRRFEVYSIPQLSAATPVASLLFDRSGHLWCAAGGGIHCATLDSAGVPHFGAPLVPPGTSAPWSGVAFLDDDGRPSFLSARELLQESDGVPQRCARPFDPTDGEVWAVAPGPPGTSRTRVVAHENALYAMVLPDPGESPMWRRMPLRLLPGQRIRALARTPDGALWIGTRRGLIRYGNEAGAGSTPRTYTHQNGLSNDWVRCLLAMPDGNLWIGTHLAGVDRLAPDPIVSLTTTDGLSGPNVVQVIEARDGTLFAASDLGGTFELRLDGARLVPGSEQAPFAGVNSRWMQDRAGDWWAGTDLGVYHFQGPRLQLSPGRRLGVKDGLPETWVFGELHEDARGRVWVGMGERSLYCREPGAARFHPVDLEGTSLIASPRRFFTDRSGTVWVSAFEGVCRWTDAGLQDFAPGPGFPSGPPQVRCIFQDSRGWLWMGTRFAGVCVTEQPQALQPAFRAWSTREGLASDSVWDIAEDATGRIALATSRGLDLLDPSTGSVEHRGSLQGLAGDVVNCVARDRHGNLWVGTNGGVSRIAAGSTPRSSPPPPVVLTRVAAGGRELPLSPAGTIQVRAEELPSSRNDIDLEFAAIDLSGGTVAYQWRIGEHGRWSDPSPQRALQLARLAPGRYRVEVRAVRPDGAATPQPATLLLSIRAPIWRRWWFLGLCVSAAAALALLLHRSRVQRLLAIERLRRQIAVDLHDDIGSGLAQIAILSEVVKRQVDAPAAGTLDEVAQLARSMRDAMGDIVWAIDPRRDHLSDVVVRMRQVSANLLGVTGIHVSFTAPEVAHMEEIPLLPSQRRQLLLFYKEAITNVARHARAAHVQVQVEVAGRTVRLRVMDDGQGFDPAMATGGHGLTSLRARADELGGRLVLESAPGRGARVELHLPAGAPRVARRTGAARAGFPTQAARPTPHNRAGEISGDDPLR